MAFPLLLATIFLWSCPVCDFSRTASDVSASRLSWQYRLLVYCSTDYMSRKASQLPGSTSYVDYNVLQPKKCLLARFRLDVCVGIELLVHTSA